MSRVIEGDPSSPLNKWPLLLDQDSIKPMFACYLGCKRDGRWILGRAWFGNQPWDSSLFWNGVGFVRISLPFWIGIGIRWSGSATGKAYVQTGIGWKGNGRFGILLRGQSDKSSAAGVSGPNYGQATGWDEGTK